jgi:hypothetical protein
MKGLKSVVVISTIVAFGVILGACEHGYKEDPMKFGAGDVSVDKPAR